MYKSSIIRYVKYFDNHKAMSFKAIDKKLLKKYLKIWGKTSILIGKEFDSKNNDNQIKRKIKSYGESFMVKKCQIKMHHPNVCH